MRADLRITDSEYVDAEKVLVTYVDALIQAASSYVSIMNRVRDEAIDDGLGRIASKCQEKAGLMQDSVYQPLVSLRSSLSGQASVFIARIDEIDRFVYGEK